MTSSEVTHVADPKETKAILLARIRAANEYLDEGRRQARDAVEVQKFNLIQAVLNGG